ncbi:hypothetical protein [Marinobacterium arenosum]|uniref:hypothetical protein n=1 Tax=Marinobacterium arenosum TaxID=2862496 RepID=UPI001C954A4C|nr:hypothetical protein [Marinobacterium arenosum]MBY4675088.1 hypothetical protein [Marinobacterium arenosum]
MRAVLLAVGALALAGCAQLSPSAQAGSVLPVEQVRSLPREVRETSGLALHQGRLWTINDSGDSARLYRLGLESGELMARYPIDGASNVDWEDLAQDADHLYIADCGNNRADRRELVFYKLAWRDLDKEAADPVPALALRVRYTDFDAQRGEGKAHNLDCEAITVVEGELWLFTKNRGDQQSRLYRLDPNRASQDVAPAEAFPVRGLITAADYHAESGQLALLGYGMGGSFGQAFIWLLPVKDRQPDWSQAHRYELAAGGQWEALVWQGAGQLLLSAESSLFGSARLATVSVPVALSKSTN